MSITIVDPTKDCDRSTVRTELMLTRKMHTWFNHYAKPGQKDEMHCHNEDQSFTCLVGECTMHFPDGGKAVLKPGMSALIHGGSFYSLENTGSGELIMFGARSGQRDKTLKIHYADREKYRAEMAKISS